MEDIILKNNNSCKTYFNVHHISEAHRYATGNEVKIGILDRFFNTQDHIDLYYDHINLIGKDIIDDTTPGHGLLMSSTLKEIAPDCMLYALNCVDLSMEENEGIDYDYEEQQRFEMFASAIQWAISNRLDIVTYSYQKFNSKYDSDIDELLQKAKQENLITTFINNGHSYNIWPYGCMKFANDEGHNRTPDLNIFHYDYNYFNVSNFCSYYDQKQSHVDNGNQIPFFSFSSMSPVLGAFVSFLRELEPGITADECKQLLIQTSYPQYLRDRGYQFDLGICERIVDIGKAVHALVAKQPAI